jgi:hypothetical protein
MPRSSEWSPPISISTKILYTFLPSHIRATSLAHLILLDFITVITYGPSTHPMALQPKSGLGLLCWGSVTIMFYGVRLLASRPTPVNLGGPMIFCWGLLP